MTNKAILVMDFINEIIHPEGKFKKKGYAEFAERNKTLEQVSKAVGLARQQEMPVIYIRVGFSEDYSEQPKNSPLFGKADEFQALKLNTWATEFHESLEIKPEDHVITKHRVSPFYNTDLNSYLKDKGIREVYLCGVATDLVVESAARDAHDRDYNVFVLEDCCAAANEEDHRKSLKTLSKIARVGTIEELL